ncbi:MAG: hypothetical protein ACI4TD_11930 [Phocaeicola sp.]
MNEAAGTGYRCTAEHDIRTFIIHGDKDRYIIGRNAYASENRSTHKTPPIMMDGDMMLTFAYMHIAQNAYQ